MKSPANDPVNEWNEDASRPKCRTGDVWQTVVPRSEGETISDPPPAKIEATGIPEESEAPES